MNKSVYIIAGPNGSGKTTFAREFLPCYAHCDHFVNADLIATGLSPFSPSSASIKAGRILLQQIEEFVKAKQDFAFESTLSGKAYAALIERLKAQGYVVTIFFLWIPAVSLAKGRIKQRVSEGGHHVPGKDVERRFGRSRENFLKLYRGLCDSWMLFDNSGLEPVEKVRYDRGRLKVVDKSFYQKFEGVRS